MHIPAYIRLIPIELRLAATNIAVWGQNQAVDIARSLFVFLVFVVSLTTFGVLLAWTGHSFAGNPAAIIAIAVGPAVFMLVLAWSWRLLILTLVVFATAGAVWYLSPTEGDFLISFGRFLIALAGIIGGLMWIYILARTAALTGIALTVAQVFPQLVYQISRPLPSTPIVLPTLISPVQAEYWIRAIGSLFAAIAGMSAYMTLFPVYTNIPALMIILLMSFFLSFALFAWDIPPTWPVKKWLVMGAFSVIVVLTVSFIVPEPIKRSVGLDSYNVMQQYTDYREEQRQLREKSDSDSDKETRAREKAIRIANEQIASYRQTLETRGYLTPEEQREVAKIQNRKENIIDQNPLVPTEGLPKTHDVNFSPSIPGGMVTVILIGMLGIALVVTFK